MPTFQFGWFFTIDGENNKPVYHEEIVIYAIEVLKAVGIKPINPGTDVFNNSEKVFEFAIFRVCGNVKPGK